MSNYECFWIYKRKKQSHSLQIPADNCRSLQIPAPGQVLSFIKIAPILPDSQKKPCVITLTDTFSFALFLFCKLHLLRTVSSLSPSDCCKVHIQFLICGFGRSINASFCWSFPDLGLVCWWGSIRLKGLAFLWEQLLAEFVKVLSRGKQDSRPG